MSTKSPKTRPVPPGAMSPRPPSPTPQAQAPRLPPARQQSLSYNTGQEHRALFEFGAPLGVQAALITQGSRYYVARAHTRNAFVCAVHSLYDADPAISMQHLSRSIAASPTQRAQTCFAPLWGTLWASARLGPDTFGDILHNIFTVLYPLPSSVFGAACAQEAYANPFFPVIDPPLCSWPRAATLAPRQVQWFDDDEFSLIL